MPSGELPVLAPGYVLRKLEALFVYKKNQDYILDAKEAALFLKYGFGAGGHESTGDYTCGSHLCAVSPDGTVSKIWVLINAHALYDSSRNIVGLEGMVTDITNRKRAERNFQMLIDSAPDAIVAIDSNYNILLINTQTESIFGYKREELLGKSYDILIPGRFREKLAGYCAMSPIETEEGIIVVTDIRDSSRRICAPK